MHPGFRLPNAEHSPFPGIDTAATIVLNGQKVGIANNMHMRWVFDVTAALHRPGGEANELLVKIIPATRYAQHQATLTERAR